MSSPFDLPKQAAAARFRPNYGAFLNAFRREYGVADPHRYYLAYRRKVMDCALSDPFGVACQATLDEWWEANVLAWKYVDLARPIA